VITVSGLKKTIEENEKMAKNVFQGSVFELNAKVKERTPVDTGFARNSWLVTKNSSYAGRPGGNSGTESILNVKSANLGDALYINNGAEYIKKLEDGHSAQAPAGMVAISIAEFPTMVKEQIKDYKRVHK